MNNGSARQLHRLLEEEHKNVRILACVTGQADSSDYLENACLIILATIFIRFAKK